ncbi:hypothetical protein BH09PAT2_BH09PAT2_11230 [soil metagenome]
MLKQTLKSVFKPVYQRCMHKLREGLQTDEQFRLLHHIVEQNIHLKKDVEILQHEINLLNILVSGVESKKGTDAFIITPEDTARDIVNILAPRAMSDVTIVQLLNQLAQDAFKNKTVCLIGAGSAFFRKELESRGSSHITTIEMNPLLLQQSSDLASGNTTYIYPSQIQTVDIPAVDILIVAHPAVSAYLLKRKLLHIGAMVKQKGYFLLTGDEQQRRHLATLITGSGFAQVSAVPEGKTTAFDYVELRELPKKNSSEKTETILYVADKLPTI